MKHLLHFNKLWTIYHFMSIQTTYVACIWRCLLWFLTLLWCLCGCHYGLLLLHFACFHIMISHSIVCAILVNLPYITLCFWYYYLLSILWYWKCIPSSHNIVTSLCYSSVECFIFAIIILRYDCKPTLNTIVKKLFMGGTCTTWTNFWIHS